MLVWLRARKAITYAGHRDFQHRQARISDHARRRGGGIVAASPARGARAAAGAAGGRVYPCRVARLIHLRAAAFRKGLAETGYIEGQNVTVEYHWLEGHYDRVPALVADVVRRQVAVIATPGKFARDAGGQSMQQRQSQSSSASPKTLSSLACRQPCPAGRQRDRHQFFYHGGDGQASCGCCMTWCPRRFVLPCSSIRPMLRQPRPRCGTCRKPPPPSGYKSRFSTPRRSARSMRPLPALRASARTPSSWLRTHSSSAAACNLSL